MRTKTAVAPPEPPESPALTLEGGPDLYLSSITAEVPEVLLSRIARWFAERKCVTPVRLSADRPYETNAGESLRYLGAHDDKFIFAGVVIERGKTNGYRCYVAPYPLDDAIFRRWKKLFVEDRSWRQILLHWHRYSLHLLQLSDLKVRF